MNTGVRVKILSARQRFIRYLLAGSACALLEYYLLVAFYGIIGLNVHVSNVIALSAAAILNYLLSRSWIFGSSERKIQVEAGLFALLVVISFTANHLLFIMLYKTLNCDYRLSKLITMVVTTFLNYKAKRHVVFSGSGLWS